MVSKRVTIGIHELVGGDAAISADDGEKVFKRIDSALEKDIPVVVDFQNVGLVVSAFLNAAIGQLYGKYAEKKITEYVKIVGLEKDDIGILEIVVERAKQYFKHKDQFQKASKRTK